MYDLKTVYVRELAPIKNIDFSDMLFVRAGTPGSFARVISVSVDSSPSKFMMYDKDSLYVVVPPGTSPSGVSAVVVTAIINDAPTPFTVTATDTDKLGNPALTVDSSLMKITGSSFSRCTTVLINGSEQQFVVVNDTMLLCTIPSKARSIENVHVVTESKTTGKNTMFSYTVGGGSSTSGIAKLIQQVVKYLLTSKGTDVTDKSGGGNLQKLVGSKVPADNAVALATRVVLDVSVAMASFQARQLMLDIPNDEKLGSLQVLNVNVDPVDPTTVEVEFKISNLTNQQALFGALLGSVQEAAETFQLGGA